MRRSRWNRCNTALAKGMIYIIRLYQVTLSPDHGILSPWLKGTVCAHTPHCSEFGRQALQRYWLIPWLPMTLERVSHCLPSTTLTYDPVSYRIVFFSSAPISIPFLETLIHDKRFDIVGLVTTIDKPQWRWLHTQDGPLLTFAKKYFPKTYHEILRTPSSLKEDSPKYGDEAKAFHQRLRSRNADFLVVLAYGKIMPATTLACSHLWPINVHGSLLPAYRGASPIQSAILHKESMSGITIMHMNEWLDEWDTIAFHKIPLSLTTTAADLMTLMQQQGPRFLADTLWDYGKQRLIATPQDHTKATLCTKITKENGQVDPLHMPFEDLYAAYKAYILRPKIYFFQGALRVIIEEICIDTTTYNTYKKQPLLSQDHTLNSCVTALIVKPEGKKKMDRSAFLAWHQQ